MMPVQPKVAPTKTTAQLRELMASPKVIDCPSIYDPISARIAESLGFKCVSLEGSALGIAVCQVEAALSLDSRYVPTLVQLALAYEYLKQPERARAYLNKAYELDPLNKVVLSKLHPMS